GLMEIAQAFVINKADREGADTFFNNIKKLVQQQHQQIPDFKTVADKATGIRELADYLIASKTSVGGHKKFLIAEKAYKLIMNKMMEGVNKEKLRSDLNEALQQQNFNLYSFINEWLKHS